MSNNVIIFGAGKIAEVVYYYFKYESNLNIVAFTCDKEYITQPEINGIPVVSFDEVEKKFPAASNSMFIAVGYQDMNALRARKLAEAKKKGYKIISYVNPNSGLPKDTQYGENCLILNNVCVQPKVIIGDNVFIWSGALIGHHTTIGSHCWITSSANISGSVKVGNNCFFAVNSTVANEINIGNGCFLGANVLVSKNMNDNEVVIVPTTPVCRLNSQQFLAISKLK